MNAFEVEIKFRVAAMAELEHQLQQRFGDVHFGEQVTESDSFFQHPSRNFIQTDECLRLRKRIFSDGTSQHFLTYKGPKIDTSTKTRQEIEMPIAQPDLCENMLVALGFQNSASVQKFRRRLTFIIDNRHVDVVFDTLPALPESNRCFVELETMAAESEVDACRSLLLGIAQQLGLSEPIRDSYLKLVQQYEG